MPIENHKEKINNIYKFISKNYEEVHEEEEEDDE